jgi:nitrogen fixation NifU-like protein
MSLYKQELIDHYRNPRHYGTIDNPTFVSELANPSCGDSVIFTGIIADRHIKDLAFTGTGCVISLAAASLLTEYCMGTPVDMIAHLKAHDIKRLVGLDLGPVRLRCALLALQALQYGIVNSKQSA